MDRTNLASPSGRATAGSRSRSQPGRAQPLTYVIHYICFCSNWYRIQYKLARTQRQYIGHLFKHRRCARGSRPHTHTASQVACSASLNSAAGGSVVGGSGASGSAANGSGAGDSGASSSSADVTGHRSHFPQGGCAAHWHTVATAQLPVQSSHAAPRPCVVRLPSTVSPWFRGPGHTLSVVMTLKQIGQQNLVLPPPFGMPTG